MSAAAPAEALPDAESPEEVADAGRGSRSRRAWAWVALVAAVVVGGIVLLLVPTQQWESKDPLDPEHPGPAGAMAIAQLLGQRGVGVEIVRSLDEAAAAASDGTLVIGDTSPLSDDDLAAALSTSDRAVLIDPSARDARVVFGDGATLFAGFGSGAVPPSCDLAAAERAGDIRPGTVWQRGTADVACYPAADGFGLLQGDFSGTEVTLVDGRELFTNTELAAGGNASLALGLLGADESLVWYMPSADDVDPALAPPTLGELTPPWVSAAIVMLGIAAVAAGIWRGRRFGPLVAETLPVTVRGSETLEGRARLYQRSGDAAHAADLVRSGAVSRMGARLGLHARASAAEVSDAAAARIGARRADVAAVIDFRPSSDAQLADFGSRIRDLEAAVDAAVRTERTPQ